MLWRDWGKQRSFISLISQHCTHLKKKPILCVRSRMFELTAAWVEATDNNISYSNVRQHSTPPTPPTPPPKVTEDRKHPKQQPLHSSQRQENKRQAAGGEMRQKAERKVTMTVFICLCIQVIAFIPPTPPLRKERLFIWFVKATRSVMKHCHNNQRDASICHLFSRSRLRWNGILIGVREWW